MCVVEKYSRSVNSPNLRADELHLDVDGLAVMAWATRHDPGKEKPKLGAMLFRVKYAHDTAAYPGLMELWEEAVKADRQWPKHIPARKLAEKSLGYWLNDICPACTGKGYIRMVEAPILSDEQCRICDGTGKKPLMCEENWRDPILDMVALLDRHAYNAGADAMKYLAKQMEL